MLEPVARVFAIVASLALAGAACSCSKKSATDDPPPSKPTSAANPDKAPPAKPPSNADADAAPAVDCDDLCTDIAVCWEEINGGDYHGGVMCSSACEERTAEAKSAFAACIKGSSDCKKTLECQSLP